MDQKLVRCMTGLKEEAEAARMGASASDLSSLISDIADLCKQSVSEEDLSFAIALVFDKEDGHFNVVQLLMPVKERTVVKARESCLVFVSEFIEHIGDRVQPHVSFVKEKCILVFRRDDSKTVQAASLLPLLSLLETNITRKHASTSSDWTFGEVLLNEYRRAKTSGTLRANILVLLGYLVEYFPGTFSEENVNTLSKICLDTLEEQLRQSAKDPVFVLVSGVVKCLDSVLTWFDASQPAGGSVESSRKIYTFLLQIIYYREDIKRYEVVKAGLRLLSRHGSLFALRLVQDSREILSWLQIYCTHTNALLRDAGFAAFNQFMEQVAKCLVNESSRVQNVQDHYKHFMAVFFDILDASSVDKKLLFIAVRGLGKLSPLIVRYSGKETLKRVFHRLTSLGGTSSGGSEAYEDSLGHSVTLAGAFADMVIHFDHVEDFMVFFIAEVTGKIFYQFPQLFPKQKQAVYLTVAALFKAMFSMGTIFSLFLSNVAWSTLERTMETSDSSAGESTLPLWPQYVDLWCHLLDSLEESTGGQSSNAVVDSDGDISCQSPSEKQSGSVKEIQEMVYDSIIRCIMKALGELNLKYRVRLAEVKSSTQDEADAVSVEPETELELIEPLNLVHMRKYLNLTRVVLKSLEFTELIDWMSQVEFSQEFLSRPYSYLFVKWIYPFSCCVMELSNQYPLISGNYKLLTTTITVADSKGYFKTNETYSVPESASEGLASEEEWMKLLNGSDKKTIGEDISFSLEQQALCLQLFRRYLKEVLVASRRYKLELLASCLRLCLSTPPGLVEVGWLVWPLQSAFKMGLRYPPLASMALDALERWHEFCPAELVVWLSDITQCLGDYLAEVKSTELEDGAAGAAESFDNSQNLSRSARLKKARVQASQALPFEVIQIRVQKFLGRIGRFSHHLVPRLNLLQVSGSGGLAWDSVDRVSFTLPFRDEKFDVWLDSLLPRVVELAISSSDRRTKVSASELLQGLCLLMLGNTAKGPVHRKNTTDSSVRMDKIYRRLLPAVLRLAVDVEQVTRQLFGEFVKQLIHWFTSNIQKENPDTMALLDAILDGLIDPENGSLREFCAGCFGEFMSWSVRHTPPEIDNFINVASMLRRLYNRMDHPNPYTRLGASMAAYRIYPVLRANASIVDRYIFELMFFCIKSLRLSESDDIQTGTVKQINKTLDSYLKLVERNLNVLQRTRKDRPMFLTLEDLMDWLLQQTGQVQEASRIKCMSVLGFICPLLPVGSLANWFHAKRKAGFEMKSITLDFSSEGNGRPSKALSVEEARHQLRDLSKSLHWYEWSVQNQMLTPKEVFAESKVSAGVKSSLSRLLIPKEASLQWTSSTPSERESYQKLVCQTIVHLLKFLLHILDFELGTKGAGVYLLNRVDIKTVDVTLLNEIIPLAESDLFELICRALLCPRDLGFVTTDLHQAEDLAKLTVGVLQRLLMASSSFKDGLTEKLLSFLSDTKYDLTNINLESYPGRESVSFNFEDAMSLLKGYQQLHLSGLLRSVLGKSRAKEMGEKLMTQVYGIGRECPPVLESIASEMLSLSLALGTEAQKLVELCLNDEPIGPTQGSKKAKAGGVFYLNFRRVIVQPFKFSFQTCLPLVIKAAPKNLTARLLLNAVLDDYAKSTVQTSSMSRDSFLKELLRCLKLLDPCCAANAELSDKQFFLEVVQKVLLLDLYSEKIIQDEKSSCRFIETSYLDFMAAFGAAGNEYGSSSGKEAQSALVTHALVLLPFFLKPTFSSEFQSQLCCTVTKVVSDYLLVRESDLPKGSNQRAVYLRMLGRLLDAVSVSSSVILLEVIFPLLLDPPKFALRRMTDSIELFCQSVGEQATDCLNLCIRVLGDETKIPRLRRAVIERVFIPLVTVAPADSTIGWFSTRIKSFVASLGKTIDSMDPEKEEESLVVKICYYTILEVLFTKFEATLIKERITPLAPNAALMKTTMSESRGKNDPGNYLHSENISLWRELHIAAYKCLAAITLRTQEQEKVFGLLFKEGPSGMIWQHLVDTTKMYSDLPVETTQFTASYQTVRGMRDDRRAKKSRQKMANGTLGTLSSQYIVNIGLSQEPAVISSFVGGSKGQSDVESGSLGQNLDDEEAEMGVENTGSILEEGDVMIADQDDFDQHPCMETVLKLIDRLYSRFGASQRDMPEWMKALHSTLENAGTHMNIRIFLSKVVAKTWKVFSPYSNVWFAPLVNTILIDPEKSGGSKFHYVLRDICITILHWNFASPPEPRLASAFVAHLISVSAHTSTSVLRANVDIIRMFLDGWKKDIQLDKRVVLKEVIFGGKSASATDRSVKVHRIVGLQLLGAVAASGLQLYDPVVDDFPEKDMYQCLLQNLNFRTKEIYEASGELLGILLKHRQQGGQELRKPIDEEILEAPLKQILYKFCRESNYDCFLNTLNKITLRFPSYVENFASLLVELLPKLPGVFKVITLDILLRLPHCLKVLLNVLLPTLAKVLTHRDELAQIKCLQLLIELAKDELDRRIQDRLLPALCETFPSHENVDCRQLYYNLLMSFHAHQQMDSSDAIVRPLLGGLADSAEKVRTSVQNFWHSNLSQDLRERFSEMINKMYDPAVEEHWAQFTNTLLLKLCEDSVDYKRPVFNAPLSDCEFHEYTINASAIGGSLPMTPLFSQSQVFSSSQETRTLGASSSQQEDDDAFAQPRRAGMIRATFSMTLSQTLDQSSSNPLSSQESSLFAMARKPFGNQTQNSTQESGGLSAEASSGLRRRIPLADSARSQIIRNVMNASKRREAREAQQKSERANKVRIMRSYRTGELPDIEIKHEDLLAPLASLAEKDASFARLLLIILCRAIYSQPVARYGNDSADFKEQVATGIQKALQNTKSGISFVGCIEAVCLEDPTIWIPPKLVGRASLKSTNFHSGILVLEGGILHEVNKVTKGPGISSKRQKVDTGIARREGPEVRDAWLELANLYRELGDDDVVLSIYQKKLTEKPISQIALEAQLSGDPTRGLMLYDQALETLEQESGGQVSQVEQDIWYNQRLACLLELNRWPSLLEDTIAQVQEDDSEEPELQRLWEPNLEDLYLGLFMRGTAKVSTFTSLANDFINASLKEPWKRDLLIKDYGTQLATFAVINDQLDRARFYISQCYKTFRVQWAALHPLATGARHRQVQKLQKIVELDEFVDVLNIERREQFARKIVEWRHRWPSSTVDGVEAWDDIVQNRIMFFNKFQGFINKLEQSDRGRTQTMGISESTSSLVSSQLEHERAYNFRQAALGLTKMGAYNAAQSYMEQYMAVYQGVTNEALDFKFFKGLVKLRCLQATRVIISRPSEGIEMVQQVLNYVRSTSPKSWATDSQEWQLGIRFLEARVASQLAWMNLEGLFRTGTTSFIDSLSLLGCSYNLYSEVAGETSGSSNVVGTSNKTSRYIAKISLEFALFCDEILKATKRMELNDEFRSVILHGQASVGLPAASAYPTAIVKHIMEAVSMDTSVRALHGLARVLSLLGSYPETYSQFADARTRVPSWVFIPWIPQMLAVMEQEEGQILVSILEQIATLYRQGLYFPFHVSEKDFGPIGRRRTTKVASLLKSDSLEGMVRGLEDLTFPEQRFRDGLSLIKSSILAGDNEQALRIYSDVFEDCLDVEAMRKPSRGAGEYNLKFGRDWSKRVTKAFGENGSKLLGMNEKKFTSAVGELLANLQKVMQSLQTGVMSLGHLSKWMAEFDQSSQGANSVSALGGYVEIPGQYSSFSEPRPDYHVKVVGFDQTVVCLSSKQRPKILTMRGSDEKDYKFVVKGGEDLRLDQRIEQLFEVMNSILQRDSQASRRGLTIRTYAVVPVSKSCGLLQFVENTSVLEDVVKDGLLCKIPSLGREGKNAPLNFLHKLRSQYHDWIMKRGGPSQAPPDCYRNLYKKASREEVTQKLKSIQDQMPWDTLRAGVARWATSAESFLALRSQFAKSLAVVSICGYIAGVGDRHLANTLVDMRSGSLIPIDFGYSFGTGVILLPIPELIPFRLTNQLVNFLLPLDAIGLLRTDMVHTLAALHGRREVITAVMDVFVKEPLVDWKNEAMKTFGNFQDKKNEDALEASAFEQQYVELKVENAQRKLERWNPAAVTVAELKSSVHANKAYTGALEKIIHGVTECNVRSRTGEICQSVQEQVDCLIDQATDPNLLGRIWQGWQPWV